MRENKDKRLLDFAILAILAFAWIAIDQATKACVDSVPANTTIAGPFLGIFDLTLVHNTGAAWGIFNGNPLILGFFSLAVCAIAVVYLSIVKPPASIGVTVGISLVVAGGLGNAIDRFSNHYVIDFIRPVFMDFPVFNIADIGVTVGVIVFLVSMAVDFRKNSNEKDRPAKLERDAATPGQIGGDHE